MGDHHTLQNFGYNIRFDLPFKMGNQKWTYMYERNFLRQFT